MTPLPTYLTVPTFGLSATEVQPDAGTYLDGYEPLQLYPAEHQNWFMGKLTGQSNIVVPAETSVINELLSILAAVGITADVLDNDQVLEAVNTLIRSLPLLRGLYNVGIRATVDSNALTVAFKQADGTTNPTTLTGKSTFEFRSSTLTAGASSLVDLTAALSLVVPSGATLGQTNAVAGNLYVYAINNAGTIKAGIIGVQLDEGLLHTSVAIDANADSIDVLYSDAVYTNVAVRLVCRINITETTAGTWATAPTSVSVPPFGVGTGQVVTSSVVIGSATSLTTGTSKTVTSIQPPAGRYLISAIAGFIPTGTTTITQFQWGISKTTNTLPGASAEAVPTSGEVFLKLQVANTAGANGSDFGIPAYVIETDGSVVFYLIARATFATSTLAAYGSITATRI